MRELSRLYTMCNNCPYFFSFLAQVVLVMTMGHITYGTLLQRGSQLVQLLLVNVFNITATPICVM